MIVWLSSYPKSGNTYIRSLLSAYIFSKDGTFNFELLKKFIQFPNKYIFEKLGLDISNNLELVKNYLKAQEFINNNIGDKNDIHFVKTHSSCASIGDNIFTNVKNTLGVVYIVRDPRNILTSYAHHFQKSHEEAANDILGELNIGLNSKTHPPTFVGSWKFHYNSWKQLSKYDKFLLIKYEDLIKNPRDNLIRILEFIFKLKNKNFKLDKKKFDKAIETTTFSKMQNLEKKYGFKEAASKKGTNDKIKFFNLGEKNNWKSILDEKLTKRIENAFNKEMKELGYL
tara:strand:+ start:3257 stop:4108 length:852 start_codon:yes stop_codon:yes gene_type:complete